MCFANELDSNEEHTYKPMRKQRHQTIMMAKREKVRRMRERERVKSKYIDKINKTRMKERKELRMDARTAIIINTKC